MVGQVGNHHVRLGEELGRVGAQDVGDADVQVWRLQLGLQPLGQDRVDLDRHHAAGAADESGCQHAQPGPDLEHQVVLGIGVGGGDDRARHPFVSQERLR